MGHGGGGGGATPVPVRPTDCGLPVPLSAIETAAVRVPVPLGVNVTLIVHVPPTPSVAGDSGQVVVLAKSPAFVPVMFTLVIVSVPGPLLVKVTDCAGLVVLVVCDANVSDAGERPTLGVGATPAPVSATDLGLPIPLSVIVTAAVRVPVAVGVNVTLMVQEALAASVAGEIGHVVVPAKSLAFVPVMLMLVIVSAPGPLLVRPIFCAALVVFVVWFPKLTLAVDRLTRGPEPPPEFVSPVDTVKNVAGLLWLL